MPKTQIRDNAYYLNRMKTEHSAIYREYVAGRLTARKAIIKAGYQTDPTPLMALKREWKKASAQERKDFLNWCRAGFSSPTIAGGGQVTTADGRLEPWAKARIDVIKRKRKLTVGAMKLEMGLGPHVTSLDSAVRRGTRIKDSDVISGLEKWLEANKHV